MPYLWRALVLVALIGPSVATGQDQVVPKPDTVLTEGMPAIPAAVDEAMAPYYQYRRAIFVAWHPVRREMLIGTTFGDTQQIHHVGAPAGARTQLTFYDDGIGGGQRRIPIDASFEPKAGKYFVFRKDTDGREHYQLYRYDLEQGTVATLTAGEFVNTLGPWAHAGDRIAFTSTRRNGTDYDIYVMNPLDPSTTRMVAETVGVWNIVDWNDDDGAVLAIERRSAAESYVWRVNVGTGEMTAVTSPGERHVSFTGATFAPDGRTAYVATDADSEYLRLARVDLETGSISPLLSDVEGDVEDFALSPNGSVGAVVVNEQGTGVLRLIDLPSGRERAVPRPPGGEVSGVAWHRNGEDLAFQLRSVHSDGDVYSIHVPTGRVDRWTTSETGGLNAAALAEPELIHWRSFDGLTISGYIFRPPARFTGRRPVMVNIHGGPEAQARPSWQGYSNYFLNELGVAIVYPNVRGSTGFGKTFMGLDDGRLREGPTKDIGALLDWIAEQPDLDEDRVMVTGASFGGYLTLAVAAEYNDRIRCAFAGFPVSNLVTDLQNTRPDRQDGRRREYGDERDAEMRAFLSRIAPLTNAARIRKPLFVAHGTNDPRVPVTESKQIVAAVRQDGGTVWYLEATNEGHGIGRRSNLNYLIDAWAYFMQEFLIK